MASATLNFKINKWTKAVIAIIKEYGKLEDSYTRAFDAVIYYTENSSISSNIRTNVEKLNEYLDGCVQSDFTTALRDFCKLSESALIDNYSDFRSELKNRGFFNELEKSYGYVSILEKEERERMSAYVSVLVKEERERMRQKMEAERRERERLEAERRRKEEEERQRRLEEEKKRREAAEKIRKEIERGRLDEERNPLKVKAFLMGMLLGLFAIAVSYVLFLSPISVIAKWTVLTWGAKCFYLIGSILGIVLYIVFESLIMSSMYDRDFLNGYLIPIGALVMFWLTYGAYRIFPILDGWVSYTLFVVFILLDIFCVIILLTVLADDGFVFYKHDGGEWTSKNQSTFKSLVLAFIGLAITVSFALLIVSKYDFGHKTIAYHHGEYKELLIKADECIANEDYYHAIKYLKQAQDRKTSEKKRNQIQSEIVKTQLLLDEQAIIIKSEIKSLLDVFKKISFKYGRPEDDLKLTQGKLDQLKKITPADPEIADLQKRLDYHMKRTK